MDWEFESSRKEQKRDRKVAQRTDRSKYKKTDVAKRSEIEIPQHLPRGQVLRIRSQEADVLLEDGRELRAVTRGSLKVEAFLDKRLLAVGDWVRVHLEPSPGQAPLAVIEAVEPRSSVLQRAEHFQRRKRQLVAANVERVAVIMSVGLPPLKPALIDRFLIAAEKGGLRPMVIFTKGDLLPAYPDQDRLLRELQQIYEGLGVPVWIVSTATGEGLEQLSEYLRGSSTVFTGQSGVGKSSLINSLTGLRLRTADVVETTRKGSHTTTQAQLLPLPTGGSVVDTPGLRSFGVWALESDEVQGYFPEIAKIALDCRFNDCRHDQEPGCAVREAVASGQISRLRFDSFQALRQGEGLRDLLDWLES
jgi:ribosome biogenesis GTPase